MTILLGQRDSEYNLVRLGFGTGTIGQYGCVLSSIAMGLRLNGWELSPIDVNNNLKSVNGFTGDTKNLIVWTALNNAFKGIIEYEQSLNYDTVAAPIDKLKTLLEQGKTVLLRLSAMNIGGKGDHFVLAYKVEGDNVIIYDPWYREIALVTKRYTRSWADTATEIITGFRVMKITANTQQGSQNMNDNEMIILKSDFENMHNKSTQWDSICEFFKIDPKTERNEKIVELYNNEKNDKENTQKSLQQKMQDLSDLGEELKGCQAIAKERKKQLDDFTEWLAGKLVTGFEIAQIKVEIEKLLNIEEKLRVANKKIETEENAHAIEKAGLQKQIADLRQELETAKETIDDLDKKIDVLSSKIDDNSTAIEKTSAWKNVIEDIAKFFEKIVRVTDKKLSSEEKKLDAEK